MGLGKKSTNTNNIAFTGQITEQYNLYSYEELSVAFSGLWLNLMVELEWKYPDQLHLNDHVPEIKNHN